MSVENTSEDRLNNKSFLSRRKILSVLGFAGLSSVSLAAVSGQKGSNTINNKRAALLFPTVAEMKQDGSIKEGDWLQTSGFYDTNDGGNAGYHVIRLKEKIVDNGEFINLKNDLVAQLESVSRVNYKMFGAKSDGKNDDGVQIKLAHDYANKKLIPVENLSGSFWVSKTNDIIIQTDVSWGKSVFHIDETHNTSISKFRISGRQKSIKVNFTEDQKRSFLEKFKSGARNISELSAYANSLLIIVDDNIKAGARQGSNAHEGRGQQEFFYVEEHGRIIGDIFLEFSDYTSLIAYPAEQSYLTVSGGTFFLSGEGTGKQSERYMSNGMQIQRSRTVIKNQWVGLANESKDTALSPRSGFYNISRVYDLQIENVRLIPWEKNRGSKDNSVPQGTYGISGSVMMNVLFRNVTAEGSDIHWGIVGTNYVKNLKVDRCFLNRFDVHSFGWNITITDSEIGQKGLTITGGGDLRVENTTCFSNTFVSFRNDYGARWDGNILIRNSKLCPLKPGVVAILQYGAKDLDYKYAIGYADKIRIEDFVIDYKSTATSDSVCWIVNAAPVSSTKQSGNLFFPSEFEVKNVSVKGRPKGVRLMNISKPNSYKLPKEFLYSSVGLNTNARLIFENIHLEQPGPDVVHLVFDKQDGTLNKHALVPLIRFIDCENLVCDFKDNIAELEFRSCSVSQVHLSSDDNFKGSVFFENCKFKPHSSKFSFGLGAVLGTSFVNCTLMLPKESGTRVADPFSVYKFIRINQFVKYNHVNTRLGQDVLAWCRNAGVRLLPEFVNKLKSHHELEDL